ncbi:MAG: ABC transporter ATP-binding protein, partial [bacterium]|nr:ABC transporter ATP-binding protein [bacterium]
IVKRFPGVLANDRIDLAVEPGEIRALVGENGAGKTTLMRVLYGEYRPDAGSIAIHGQAQHFRSPHDAIRAGLGMVHQHFMLFPSLSVCENVIYGEEPTRRGFIDRQNAFQRVAALSQQHGLDVDPAAKVAHLPLGVRQRVEIVKILYRQADILILDEPTAVLTHQEQEGLFTILRGLAKQGKTIIFISHKLHEVMQLSERITVLRNGKVSGNLRTSETSPEEICRHMIGRDAIVHVEKTPVKTRESVLKLEHLCVQHENGRNVVDELSFQVQAGEIVGIAGVAGNGQTELIEAISGLRPVADGRIVLDGEEMTTHPVKKRREHGLAYIPEDRGKVGLALQADISENLLMGFQRQAEFSTKGLLRFERIRKYVGQLISQYRIKVSNVDDAVDKLSGGNLQKVVAAREFSQQSHLLIAEQPTRGLDIGSIEFIHQQLVKYRDAGHGVLLVSAELSEIMDLSDRILVMFKGRIVGDMPAAEADKERLGLLMAGGA